MPDDTEIDNFVQRAEGEQNRIRSFAFIVSVCICVLFSLGFILNSRDIGMGQPSGIELESRINPNDAPPASLVRLPGIGIVRAKAIVTYREEFSKKDSDSSAFRSCEDLQKVKGIGPKTVENISEWLKFE